MKKYYRKRVLILENIHNLFQADTHTLGNTRNTTEHVSQKHLLFFNISLTVMNLQELSVWSSL